jgi:uncharacterized cupin superfamily protein
MSETRRPGSAAPATITDVPKHIGSGYPEPFASRMGAFEKQSLGDLFDLTQFGVIQVTLQAGAQSALRHWHSLEDEFVYMLSGKLTLITDDGETVLEPGQCIGFKAGRRNAHHLVNQGTATATFLAVGSRVASDNAFYPDDDLLWVERPDGIVPAHKDGRFYQD